jgi:hypothetical protein
VHVDRQNHPGTFVFAEQIPVSVELVKSDGIVCDHMVYKHRLPIPEVDHIPRSHGLTEDIQPTTKGGVAD